MSLRTLVAVLSLLALGTAAQAAESTGYRYPLFDGGDLDSLHITGCKVAVREGNLLLEEGDGLVRSEHEYDDFVLELKWRPLRDERWDSGIYFRCPAPPPNRPREAGAFHLAPGTRRNARTGYVRAL